MLLLLWIIESLLMVIWLFFVFLKILKNTDMPMYVYRIHLVLSPADAPLFPDEAFDLSKQTILFKCERKAKNFIQKTLESYKRTGEFDLWSPDQYTWCLDSTVTNARLTFLLEECRVRT